jgi:uncharacterized membrane protein
MLLQFVSTWAMVGLIWFVQVVHYPLMGQVGSGQFIRYEIDHQRLTSYVVGPFMLVEFASALLLLWFPPTRVPNIALWVGVILIGIIWICTYTIQVPQHTQLMDGFNETVQRQLVVGNWLRTIAWSLRGLLVTWMVSRMMLPETSTAAY